jgi:hypothetical protein
MKTAAHKLLLVFLELKYRTILTGITWTGQADDSSISIAYRQFLSLSKYTGLDLGGPDPEEMLNVFAEGGFVKKRPLEKYDLIASALEDYEPQLREYAFWENDSFQFKYRQVKGLFFGLMSFKLKTDFRYFGPIEGLAPGGAYAHFLRMNVFDKKVLHMIDSLMEQIIDPELKPFDVDRLVRDFNYPAEDYETRYLEERTNEAF